MRIDSSGRVLINTTTAPDSASIKLTIGTTADSDNSISLKASATGENKIFFSDGTGDAVFAGFLVYQHTNNVLQFGTNSVERMRIDSSGNVGIGTSSPDSNHKLEISGSGNTEAGIRSGSAALAILNFGTLTDRIPGRIIYNNSNNSMAFNVNSAERARITSGGVLLVGTTSALLTESAFGANSSANTSTFKTSAGASGWCSLMWNSATSGDNKFVEFLTETVSTPRGSVDYNRTGGLTRYNTTSDATLKNILGDSDGAKSVEILNSTRIREYAWKDDETQKPQIGVIAQELYETYKGAVSVGGDYEVTIPAVTEQRLVSEAVLDEDGNEIEAAVYETVEVEPERTETKYRPWGVDKTAFTFHLVAGWQAHEKLIKQQAETIAALEARIAALEGN
jgi:hypothetical protein